MKTKAPPRAAGVVVFRRTGAGLYFLVLRAYNNWDFPKGHVEDGESLTETAVRETLEEAGVVGEAIESIGAPLEFEFREQLYRVQYFLIRLISETDAGDGREKKWFPVDEALERVSFDGARALLRAARAQLEKTDS